MRPLVSACMDGQVECARLLLNENICQETMEDALAWAEHEKQPECAALVRQALGSDAALASLLADEEVANAKAAGASSSSSRKKKKKGKAKAEEGIEEEPPSSDACGACSEPPAAEEAAPPPAEEVRGASDEATLVAAGRRIGLFLAEHPL